MDTRQLLLCLSLIHIYTHIHWHLFPRVSGDLEGYGNNGKGPVWWYPMEKMYSEENCPSGEELENMKWKLAEELEKRI